jgi:hypothetical protein
MRGLLCAYLDALRYASKGSYMSEFGSCPNLPLLHTYVHQGTRIFQSD